MVTAISSNINHKAFAQTAIHASTMALQPKATQSMLKLLLNWWRQCEHLGANWAASSLYQPTCILPVSTHLHPPCINPPASSLYQPTSILPVSTHLHPPCINPPASSLHQPTCILPVSTHLPNSKAAVSPCSDHQCIIMHKLDNFLPPLEASIRVEVSFYVAQGFDVKHDHFACLVMFCGPGQIALALSYTCHCCQKKFYKSVTAKAYQNIVCRKHSSRCINIPWPPGLGVATLYLRV